MKRWSSRNRFATASMLPKVCTAIFYEAHMDHNQAEFSLSDLIPFLDALWQLIPDEYTGGLPFA